MNLKIILKDGSEFELSVGKIKFVSLDANLLKINLRNEDIIIETHQIQSFIAKQFKTRTILMTGAAVYANTLVTILTNLLQKNNG